MIAAKRQPAAFLLPVLAFAMLCVSQLMAAVADPQVKTDHPFYQGELSCSTYERVRDASFAHFASLPGGKTPTTETEKLVALWAWRVAHHQHADGNDCYYGANARLGSSDGWSFCRDGLVGLFSHSTGLCYSIHAQFTPFAQLMLGDRRKAAASLVPGHTSFEAFTDGKWRWADMTCGSMFFQDTSSFNALGIQDMIANGASWCAMPERKGPLNLYLMPFGDSWFSSFVEYDGKQKFFGYLGMPIVYVLKSGESFTRWHNPAGDDGIQAIWSKDYINENTPTPDYHGMIRRETFLNYAPVGSNSRGRTAGSVHDVQEFNYSCKGVFVYSPDLTNPTEYKEGVFSETNATTSGGYLRGNGGPGTVIFQHGSPYQIAAHVQGSPASVWNVKTATCDQTAILSGSANGSVPVSVSLDNGATWTSIGTASGTFNLDFSQIVKGRFAYLLKLDLGASAGLKTMTLRTVVQVGPAVFPQLKSNGSQVTFQPGNLGVVYGGPEREKALTMRDPSKDVTGKTAFKIVAPGPIRSLHGVAASSGSTRGPFGVETSIDGTTWEVAMAPVILEPGANQNLNSSIWGNGYNAFMWGHTSYPSATATTGWVRFQNMCITAGQERVEVYATYQLPSTNDTLVTFNWTDASGTQTASRTFSGTGGAQTWNLPTGNNTYTNWVKFECLRQGNGDPFISSYSPGTPVTVPAGTTQVFKVTAWDPDGDPLTYTWKIDGVTTGQTTNAQSYSPTSANVGAHTVEVIVSDGKGGTDTQLWNVTVTAPTVTVTAPDAAAAETAAGEPANTGYFRVARTGATTTALTVNYTVGGTATAGSDYTALAGTATIPAGAAYVDVVVAPVDDGVAEGNETVVLTLGANAAYVVGSPSSATVTIADNEPTVTVTAPDAAAAETAAGAPANPGVFRIARAGGSTAASLTVNYSVGGTATAGSDYTALAGTATIPAGAASVDLLVQPVDDGIVESSETVILTLTAKSAYFVGSPSSATVTIADRLPTVTVTAPDAAAAETAAGAVANTGYFRIARAGGVTTAPLTVNYTVAGTATPNTDYTALSGTATIPAGVTYVDVKVVPVDDAVAEAAETVILTLTAKPAYSVGTAASATVTIADNDK